MAYLKEDEMTELDLIKDAIAVQDACNLSGVVRSFSRGITRLRKILESQAEWSGNSFSTTQLNQHRYCRLYADKIKQLAGDIELGDFSPNSCKE